MMRWLVSRAGLFLTSYSYIFQPPELGLRK